MVSVNVFAGICGFSTTIKVLSEDFRLATLQIESECEIIQKVGKELQELDIHENCFAQIGDSTIYRVARKYHSHAACPVPSAITKILEIAGGLALPENVHMKFEKI